MISERVAHCNVTLARERASLLIACHFSLHLPQLPTYPPKATFFCVFVIDNLLLTIFSSETGVIETDLRPQDAEIASKSSESAGHSV